MPEVDIWIVQVEWESLDASDNSRRKKRKNIKINVCESKAEADAICENTMKVAGRATAWRM